MAPPRRQYAKAVLDDAKRRMIVQLRWLAMQAKSRRDTRQRRTAAELEAEKSALRMYVNKYVARRRAVNLLHVMAADKYKGGSLELSIKCLDAMRRMAKHQLNALPVFNDQKRYLGLVDCMELAAAWPFLAATASGATPRGLFVVFTAAPPLSKMPIVECRPYAAAACSAAQPLSSTASTMPKPHRRNVDTRSSSPAAAARGNVVAPTSPRDSVIILPAKARRSCMVWPR